LHPESAIEEFKSGKIGLYPPQYYILETLRTILTGSSSTESQRNAVQMLSRAAFGRMVINPKFLLVNDGADEAFVYEGDELRGGSKGRLHRMVVERKGAVRHHIPRISDGLGLIARIAVLSDEFVAQLRLVHSMPGRSSCTQTLGTSCRHTLTTVYLESVSFNTVIHIS
jgi:hypothetical protein